MAKAGELVRAALALAGASISAPFAEGVLDLTWFAAAALALGTMDQLRRSGVGRPPVPVRWPSRLICGAIARGGCVLIASARIWKALAMSR